MTGLELLNPDRERSGLDPVALSRRLVEKGLETRRSRDCGELDRLAGGLASVEPARLGQEERLAFWLNVYNALLLHSLCRRSIRGNLLRHLRLFDRIAYEIGGDRYTLNLIEHGILRRNRRPPLRARPPMRRDDRRLALAPPTLDPRVHFALNCGARSCPPVRPYDPESVDTQLELATGAYMQAESTLDGDRRRIVLPRLLRIYRADFGDRGARLAFAARHLPALRAWLAEGEAGVRVRYGRFDWTVATPAFTIP